MRGHFPRQAFALLRILAVIRRALHDTSPMVNLVWAGNVGKNLKVPRNWGRVSLYCSGNLRSQSKIA